MQRLVPIFAAGDDGSASAASPASAAVRGRWGRARLRAPIIRDAVARTHHE